jgi:hypothetical protein
MFTADVLENLDAATAETFADPATYTKSRGEVEAAIYSRFNQLNTDDLQFEQLFISREALARCKAKLAAGGKADYETEHNFVSDAIGVSRQTAPAKYEKRPSITLLPSQATEQNKAAAAMAECAEIRRRGGRPDSTEVFHRNGL